MINKNTKFIDISWPITKSTTQYKNKKEIDIIPTKTFENDKVRENLITLGSHSGTHIDFPAHFTKEGKNLSQTTEPFLIGICQVLDLTNVNEKISKTDLEKFNIEENEIILLKTKNSLLEFDSPFNPNFIYLEKSGAEFLASKKPKAVGIDYLGIERNQPNHGTHLTLLKKDILIIEGLRLSKVKISKYLLICLPLLIPEIESSPARAILIKR